MENDVIDFLKESNNIEDEWDDVSLAQALYAWNYIIKEEKLTPGVLLKTHKILMLHHKLMPDEKGYFRKVGVRIGARYGKPWYAIPELIETWCARANTAETEEQIKADHVAYEEIHPFVDGNGRTGRIFMNWTRVKKGFPILVIREKEKQEYYDWFQ